MRYRYGSDGGEAVQVLKQFEKQSMEQKYTIITMKRKGRESNVSQTHHSLPACLPSGRASSPKKKGGNVTKIYKNICLF